MTTKPKVGIIGNGNVGAAIEKGLARSGYQVKSVGKEPAKVKEIGQWADLVVLAIPYAERENGLRELGDLSGKTLLDVTNALTPSYDFAHDLKKSGAEELQEKAPGARVVKAFNTVFADNISTGKVKGETITLLVAGDAPEAKETVLQLGRDIGFDAVDAGPLKNARWLEAFGYLNIQLGFGQKMGSQIGFRLVR